MKSYGQFCAVARALDVIGDRWTLLIIRELFAAGPGRYADLLDGLPGIPTNLLAERLRALQEADVVERRRVERPVPGTLYALTARGEALWPVLREIGTWGGPLLASGAADDEFRTHWLAVPARLHLVDREPGAAPVRVAIETGSESLSVEIDGAHVTTRRGDDPDADLRISGDPQSVVRTLVGVRGPGEPGGAAVDGDPALYERIRPEPFAPPL